MINELRIGNIVEAPRIGKCFVNGIQLHSNGNAYVFVVANGMEYQHRIDVDNLKPIPLTPELLEQCGFVNYENWLSKECGDDLYLNWKNGFIEIGRDANCYGGNRRNLYLHQLQNLYFALTSEELKVNSSLNYTFL